MNQKLINDFKLGKITIEINSIASTSDIEDLNEVIKEAFPAQEEFSGFYRFYYCHRIADHLVDCSDDILDTKGDIVKLEEFFKDEFEYGELVEVSGGTTWFKRYFVGLNPVSECKNKYICVNTDGSVAKYCSIRKIPKEVELTLDQIAEKFNITIDQLKIKK